jgi:phage-related protein
VTTIDAVTLPVQTAVDAVASPVHSAVNLIAFTIKTSINAVAFTVESIREPIPSGIRCAVRLSIKPRINSITHVVQAIVNSIPSIIKAVIDAITFVIKPVFNAVTALIQAVRYTIILIGENAAAEECDAEYEQRDDCHVPNFPVFHIRTPCV